MFKLNMKDKKPKKKLTKEEIKAEKDYQKAKSDFKRKFNREMFELGLVNKFNRTYWLRIVSKEEYGYYAQLYLEDGLSFTKFKDHIGTIQENLQCIWIMKHEQFAKYADIEIVINPLDEEVEYENPQIKPWQMFIGLDFTLKPIINKNVNEICMFLLSGATRSGKTRLIYMILLSYILGCSPNEVHLYITDIAKDEYINFQYVKHVKWYANDLEHLHKMMMYLDEELDKRKKLISKIREKRLGTTIIDYNKISKDKLPYSYLLIDELSIIMPDNTDSKEEKEAKNQILDILKRIEKIGAAMGIFALAATQKTSKDEMIPIVKNMSAVRISFRANDRPSSEVIMGDSSAIGLAKRYAVYSFNGGEEKDYLFSPNLSIERLNELLEPYIDDNHKQVKLPINDKKQFDPSKIEIRTKLKPIPKAPDPKIIPLFIINEEDECIDY